MSKPRIYKSWGQHHQDVMFCKSCDQECNEQLKCERCWEPGCRRCLKYNENGEKLCLNCYYLETDLQIQAAKKAAHSGSYHDLHKYIKERKRAR